MQYLLMIYQNEAEYAKLDPAVLARPDRVAHIHDDLHATN